MRRALHGVRMQRVCGGDVHFGQRPRRQLLPQHPQQRRLPHHHPHPGDDFCGELQRETVHDVAARTQAAALCPHRRHRHPLPLSPRDAPRPQRVPPADANARRRLQVPSARADGGGPGRGAGGGEGVRPPLLPLRLHQRHGQAPRVIRLSSSRVIRLWSSSDSPRSSLLQRRRARPPTPGPSFASSSPAGTLPEIEDSKP
mmetsp:Transcript_39709/g.81330  ORF Transcript_39709/g.81330 Transcript_39709/m.81330 type:complete len:200 (+) Transcript_39709:1428-2027(+)